MENAVGLVLTILAMGVACVAICARTFEKEKGLIAFFWAVTGASMLLVACFVAHRYGYGRAAGPNDLKKYNVVYCVAAKVDDTYVIRNVGENKNYLFYSPTEPVSACFVYKNYKLVPVTPAMTVDGRVVGIPIVPFNLPAQE